MTVARQFTPDEDRIILEMMAQNASWQAIAARLGRGDHSVRGRGHRLDPKRQPLKSGTKWKDEELAVLRDNPNLTVAELATRIPHRSEGAIRQQLLTMFGTNHQTSRATGLVTVGNPIGRPFKTSSGIVAYRASAEAVSLPYIPTIHSSGTSRPDERAAASPHR